MQSIHCLLLLGAFNLVFIVSNVYGCVSTGVPTCQGLSGCGGYQPMYQPQPVFQPQPAYYPQQQFYQQQYFPQQACCNPCGGFGRRKRATCPYGRKKRQEAEALIRVERNSDALVQSGNHPDLPRVNRVTRDASTADERFMQCCAGRGLSAACMNHCTFQTFNKDLLSRMYFHLDQCPLENAADIHFCAAQGKDHSQCCVNEGVGLTLGGQKCLVFCNQIPGYVTKLDLTYLPCYDRFDAMKSCFYNSMITNGKK